MLEPFAEDLWTEARPLRFLGLETGTRMTVVRLGGGRLFVHSPVALDASTRESVDALGTVTAVIAPSLFHHLYVGEWAKAYPGAAFLACPGLEKKRKDLRWTALLGDDPEDAWRGELEQMFFSARAMENEVVFFHRKSKTILCADLIFNLASHPSSLTRAVARVLGQREAGVTLLERLMIRNRVAAREQIERVLQWGAERIVLAHGDSIEDNASDVVRRAYEWL